MTSKFSVKISINAQDNTRAIFDSINTDNEFYPENPTKTRMTLQKDIQIRLDSDQLPHLRANLNSTLRLVQACHDTIQSVKI